MRLQKQKTAFLRKKCLDTLGSYKTMHVRLDCFLLKKVTKNHFAQLKMIVMTDNKTTFSLDILALIMHFDARSKFLKDAT